MSELAPHERALIEQARMGEAPSEQVRRRVRRAVFARLGVASATAATASTAAKNATASVTVKGTASTGLAAAAPSAAGTALATAKGAIASTGILGKVVVASSIAAVGIGVAASTSEPSTPPSATTTASIARPIATPAPAPRALPAIRRDLLHEPREASADKNEELAPAQLPAKPSAHASGARPVVLQPIQGKLGAEVELLHAAQDKLQAGDAKGAFELLETHQDTYPQGGLSEERQAARVFTLCAMGEVEKARAEAAQFLRNAPRSPLADRVRSTCAGLPPSEHDAEQKAPNPHAQTPSGTPKQQADHDEPTITQTERF